MILKSEFGIRKPEWLRSAIVALLLMLPFAGYAKSPVQDGTLLRLSLQDCIDYAMRNADTIKNVRLAVQKQQAVNNQIKASALPQVNGSLQVTDFVNPQQSLVPGEFTGRAEDRGRFVAFTFSPKYNSSGAINGSQSLFDGSLLVALKARKTIIEALEQASTLTQENVRYNIQRAYYAVVIGEQQFRTITASLATARDMANDVTVLYRTGFAERIDVNRTEVQLTNLETDSIRVASLLETGRQALKYTIGMDIEQPIELTDTSLAEHTATAMQLLTEQLDYAKRTEVSLASTAVRLNEYNVKRFEYAALPTLNAIGSLNGLYGSNKFGDLFVGNNYVYYSMIGLQLNVPIFSGFRRLNQVKEAKIDLEMSKNRLHLLKQGLDFQTAQSQTTLRNALLSAEKQRRNLELANTIVDLARRKYKAGVGSNLEVNQAQTELLLAQNNYYSILLDVVNAQADVEKALGAFAN
jgi:outer membrane protein TolC